MARNKLPPDKKKIRINITVDPALAKIMDGFGRRRSNFFQAAASHFLNSPEFRTWVVKEDTEEKP